MDARLTSNQLSILRRQLLEERTRLKNALSALESEANAAWDCSIRDSADVAVFRERESRSGALFRTHQSHLSEVEAALVRLDNGVFGRCEDTGRSIPFARLRVVPWARTCVE